MKKFAPFTQALVLLLLLSACGDDRVAQPTATPALASPSQPATPAQTTVTTTLLPTPSEAATARPSETPAELNPEEILRAAADQTKAITVYRIEFMIAGLQSQTPLTPTAESAASPTPSAPERVVLVDYKGEFNGGDSHWTYKGLQSASVGLDPALGLEVVSVGGTTYALGPLPMSGALKPGWYNLGSEPPPPARPPILAGRIVQSLLNPGVDLSLFELAGSETLDGQQCRRYNGGREVTLNALNGLGATPAGEPMSVEQQVEDIEFERTETSIWLCADTYIHQIKLDAAGRERENLDIPFDVQIALHLSDIYGTITIEAPEGAVTPEPRPTTEVTPTP